MVDHPLAGCRRPDQRRRSLAPATRRSNTKERRHETRSAERPRAVAWGPDLYPTFLIVGAAKAGTTSLFGTEFNRGADRPRVKRRLILGLSESRAVVRLGEAMPSWSKPALHRLTRRPPTRVRADLDPETAERLIGYLREDIRAFGEFLGEDLSAWEAWPDPGAGADRRAPRSR
jgi:hypothetical protein